MYMSVEFPKLRELSVTNISWLESRARHIGCEGVRDEEEEEEEDDDDEEEEEKHEESETRERER